jgi:hypothetical protein
MSTCLKTKRKGKLNSEHDIRKPVNVFQTLIITYLSCDSVILLYSVHIVHHFTVLLPLSSSYVCVCFGLAYIERHISYTGLKHKNLEDC